MRLLRLLIVAVLGGSLLPLAGPSAAFEETPTDVPTLQSVSDMEVSDEYVFLVGPPNTDIVVFDHTATLVGTISGLTSATSTSMFLDGTDLWVGMTGADHLDRYDVSGSLPFPVTQFDITPFSLASNGGTLAVAGDRVWFEDSGSTVRPLDPSDGSVGAAVSIDPETNRLLATPGNLSALWAGSVNSVTRFEAVGDTLTLLADVTITGLTRWSAVSRDGSSVFVPRIDVYGATELDGATLQESLPRPRYRTLGEVRGAAPNPTGRRLAVVSAYSNDRPRLTIFNTQNRAVVFDRQILTAGFVPSSWSANLVAYSPDGSNLFLVLGKGASRTPWLLALPGVPQKTRLRITPLRARFGVVTSIAVHLDAFSSTANRHVRLFMEPEGQANRLVRNAQVNSKGDLVFRVRLLRSATFTAEWDGDASYFAQTEQRRVYVSALVKGVLSGFYGTSNAYRLYHHGSKPVFVARVRPSTPTKQGERIRFILERHAGGRWRQVGTTVTHMNQQNVAGVRLIGWARGNYRIHAVFLGDRFHVSTPSRFSFLRITN